MTTSIAPVAPLRAALDALADAIAGIRFDLPAAAQDLRRRNGSETVGTIRDYLIPRLGDLEGPATAVLLGSTGSGKSTIVNTLARSAVSRVGPVRPTTMAPVILAHPSHEDHGRKLLEDSVTDATLVTLDDPLLEGASLIDSPDFDSVRTENREAAEELLDRADLCVFVTSAQRYADAVPWEFLVRARRRSLPLFFVLNRVPPEDEAEVVADYTSRLHDNDLLDGSAVLVVFEQDIDPKTNGLALPDSIAPLRSRLELLGDRTRRIELIKASTRGAVADTLERASWIVTAAQTEHAEAAALVAVARRAYEDQIAELDEQVAEGTIVRGAIAARWQDLVGGGQLAQALGEGASRVRGWLRRVFGGDLQPVTVQREARSELVWAVVRRADRAAAAAADAWRLDPAGSHIVDATGDELWGHGAATPDRAERAVDGWMVEVAELVAAEGAGRKRLAQAASYGVNAVAVTLMVTAFVHTGGLTGAEVGVAAGAAAAQQTVLEMVFGKAAAATLIGRARLRLVEALHGVLEADRARFDVVVPLAASEDDIGAVRRAAAAVDVAADGFYR